MMMTDKRLIRSRDDKMIGGVCGGLGEYFGIDPTLIRIVFAMLIVFGLGSPLLLYLLLWVIIPGATNGKSLPAVDSGAANQEIETTSGVELAGADDRSESISPSSAPQ